MAVRLDQSMEVQQALEEAKLDLLDYEKKWNRFRIRLDKQDIQKNKDLLIWLLKKSYGTLEDE
jgi:hypothetical protein